MVSKDDLERVLEKAWCKETSSDPEGWSSENRAWGQCAVTALLVQDYLGGEMVWAEAQLPDGRRISHYFNYVERREIDFTRRQFPEGTSIPTGREKKKEFPSTREYVLSYEATRIRYETLKERVNRLLF